jgi:(p)ppGpp synthase/HD superfamily hydrolase
VVGDFGVKVGWIGVDIYTGRLREALRFAEKAHRGQFRKPTEDVPCVLHPISVAMILAGAGADEDLVIAGLLHDVVEDTSVDLTTIEGAFGASVAATVAQLTKATDDVLTPSDVAERLQSEEAVLVKSADLIANLGDILFDAAEHGSAHLKKLFRDPAAKLRSYLELAELLVDRLSTRPELRDSLMQFSSAARPLLEDLET